MLTFLLIWAVLSVPAGLLVGYLIRTGRGE
jgi:hypothetical protein